LIYLTDEIIIVTVSKDKNGVITETDGSPIDARIKGNNRLLIDSKGQEIMGQNTIIIDAENTVLYGYKVKIRKIKGAAFSDPDKKFIIHRIDPIGGYSDDFIRIET
jgi:hypothetical protein